MADERGPVVLGVCGGFQMLGARIDDPLGVESDRTRVAGLGLLDVSTRFAPEKARHRVSGHAIDGDLPITGYEIHMGATERGAGALPWFVLRRARDGSSVQDGARDRSGRVFGTYVHGLFDSLPFTAALGQPASGPQGARSPRRLAVAEPSRLAGGALRAACGAAPHTRRPRARLGCSALAASAAEGAEDHGEMVTLEPAAWSLPLGAALDALLGDPRGWPHPVRLIGRLIGRAERALRWLVASTGGAGRAERCAGVGLALVVVGADHRGRVGRGCPGRPHGSARWARWPGRC